MYNCILYVVYVRNNQNIYMYMFIVTVIVLTICRMYICTYMYV